MKKIFTIFLAVLPVFLMGQLKEGFEYKIKGDIRKVQDPVKKVILSYYSDGKRTSDTALVKKGEFSFKGRLPETTRANLRLLIDSAEAAAKGINRLPFMERDVLTIFPEKGKMVITTIDSFSNSKVTGSATQEEYAKLKEKLKSLDESYKQLSKEYAALYRAKDEEGMKRIVPKFDEIEKQMQQINGEFVKSNPQSPYALFALNEFAGYDIDANAVEPLFKILPISTQLSPSGKALAQKLEIAKKTGIGMYAMDFTQNDTSDRPVKLSSFRGRYVLLDFWASWCGPCRAENPNVVKAFSRFKDKGFTVLGVSLDRPGQKEKWLKAIHDDQLAWTHVSDLK